MEDLLVKAGLNAAQARLYLYLLDHGEAAPPAMAKALGLTRSNAYKVLEQLEGISLVQRLETSKKVAYRASDPMALASLAAEQRNRAIALEQHVNDAMKQLKAKYRVTAQKNQVGTGNGKPALLEAYEQQAEQKQPIYFVKSRADIPFMGFDAMHHIRMLPAKQGIWRFGITPDGPEVPRNPVVDKRSNLNRTWIPTEQYTVPVEWTVSGDELLIVVFEDEGRYIRIKDATVAHAFEQLWKLTDANIRANPSYDTRSPKAGRDI